MRVSTLLVVAYPVVIQAVARRRDPDEVFAVDAAALAQVAFAAVVGALAVWRLSQSHILRGALVRAPIGFLTAYGALGVLSALWSERPDYTVYRAMESLAFLTLIVDSVNSEDSLVSRVKPQLLFAVVTAVTWQFSNLRFELSLEALHESGVSGAVVGALFLGGLVRGWRWRIAHAVVGISVLLSTSTASYVAVLGGLAALAFFSPRPRPFLGVVLATMVGGFAWIAEVDPLNWLAWNKSSGSLETATGRLPVWAWVLEEKMPERPLIGFGFGVGESLARLYNDQAGGLRMIHMHNTLVSGIANLGLLGGCLVLLFWGTAGIAAWRVGRLAGVAHPFAAFAGCVVNSLAVPSIGGMVSLCWIGQAYLVAALTPPEE